MNKIKIIIKYILGAIKIKQKLNEIEGIWRVTGNQLKVSRGIQNIIFIWNYGVERFRISGAQVINF